MGTPSAHGRKRESDPVGSGSDQVTTSDRDLRRTCRYVRVRFRRRRWWIAAACLGMVAMVAAGFAMDYLREPSPCHATREFVDFNQSQREYLESRTRIPAAGSDDEPSAPSDADYQKWADGLQERAERVTAPTLAPHARRVAELAGQAVSTMLQVRSEVNSHAAIDPQPPPSMKAYAAISKQFTTELNALNAACPTA
jgi:hypothetical protein